MRKPESVQENTKHKILWDFEIQTDSQIPAPRPDLVLTKMKRTCHLGNFAVPVDHMLHLPISKKTLCQILPELGKIDHSDQLQLWQYKNKQSNNKTK